MPISEVYNCDCNDFMKTCKDKQFPLAIVDPPYGIGINMNMGRKKGKRKDHLDKKWDNMTPDDHYFNELQRISKHQIIWGGNYFDLPLTRAWIVWDKSVPAGVSFSDGELAWTSFDSVLRIVHIPYSGFQGMENNGKIHPTQKPVQLYKWLLKNYAKEGDTIFDSHMGSQSSRIACYEGGFYFVGCGLDKDYFDAGCKRFENYKLQLKLF